MGPEGHLHPEDGTALQALTVICYLLILTHVLWCIWASRYLWNWVRRWLQRMRQRRRDPAFFQKVEKVMERRRVERGKAAILWVAHFVTVLLTVLLVAVHEGGCPFGMEYEETHLILELLPMCCILFTSLLCTVWPWLVSPTSLDLMHTLLIGCLTAFVCLDRKPVELTFMEVGYHGSIRLMVVFALGNNNLALVLNALYSFFTTLSYVTDMDSFRLTWVYEVLALVVVTTIVCLLHSWHYSEARAELEASMNVRTMEGVYRMLSAMCDSVAHLDPDFVISRPAPRLEGMLAKPVSEQHLKGTSFWDLLRDDERERVRRHLLYSMSSSHTLGCRGTESAGDGGYESESVACSVHTHMQDENGMAVRVQIYHAPFVDAVDGRIWYVIGVREDHEPHTMGFPASTASSERDHLQSASVYQPLIQENVCFLPGFATSPTMGAGSCLSAGADVSVHVDISTHEYEIRKYSQRFAEIFGQLTQGAGFLSLIERSQRSAFVMWAQSTFNSLVHNADQSEHSLIATSMQVVLAAPPVFSCTCTLIATMEIVVPALAASYASPSRCSSKMDEESREEEDNEDECALMFVLRGIQCILGDRVQRQRVDGTLSKTLATGGMSCVGDATLYEVPPHKHTVPQYGLSSSSATADPASAWSPYAPDEHARCNYPGAAEAIGNRASPAVMSMSL